MENEDSQIVVWVDQEEKIVCGLTKHTTSAEVIKALLEERQAVKRSKGLLLDHKAYCIVERWKHFKRILPPSTKILQLWKAWGKEQISLSFDLVETTTLQPSSMWRTAENDISPGKLRNYHRYSAEFFVKGFTSDKQKRIVRNTFRKLAKMKKDMGHQEKNSIKKLNQVIISQDHIIKQQTDTMLELDRKIEEYGSSQRLEKVENHGKNFAHNSYMIADDYRLNQVKSLPDMDSLVKLLHIQTKLINHHLLIEKMSKEIKEEIASIRTDQNRDMCFVDEEQIKNMGTYTLESVRREVDESLQVGLQLHSLFNKIQKEVQCINLVRLRQKNEYKILMEELKSVCASNATQSLCYGPQEQYKIISGVANSKDLGDIAIALPIMDVQNDTDSDTGISSSYTQDSELVS
ncbi:ras association domain-containing protein 9 [Mixophyes fleayi]|uniref:ras association domain-containing protein 9 n=1 Tax=Mixophyes fleayi TaxID=3061075 RepID=UPI003F4E0206